VVGDVVPVDVRVVVWVEVSVVLVVCVVVAVLTEHPGNPPSATLSVTFSVARHG